MASEILCLANQPFHVWGNVGDRYRDLSRPKLLSSHEAELHLRFTITRCCPGPTRSTSSLHFRRGGPLPANISWFLCSRILSQTRFWASDKRALARGLSQIDGVSPIVAHSEFGRALIVIFLQGWSGSSPGCPDPERQLHV
ncbi:uncharacterized protein PV07_06619 [Cladophialophora immunda]|uniref:Uncharacterized protein n=1 Tax=Cladophialophora immunda TaxID=569365 RepID=A0A0D2C8K2_9EURO|nr:uncharacterized protein PV07_06619 [Cladophialophora immunda]KIW26815.1 hypothetical protein PV07_06619 [Cladophialophora immunda]